MEKENKIQNQKLAASITQATDTIERDLQIFYDSILDTPTFDESLGIQIVPSSRDKFSMLTGSTSGLIQAYSSKPSVAGTISTSDQEFSIFKQLIFTDFEYDALKDTVWKDAIANLDAQGLPADLEEWMIDFIGRDTKQTLANGLWNGNGSMPGDPTDFDGWRHLIKDILTSNSLTDRIVSFANDPTDKDEIQALVDSLIDECPTALLANKADTRIMVGPGVAHAILRSYQTTANANIRTDDPFNFGGFNVQMVDNLSDRAVIIGKPSNLGLGLGVGGDVANINVVDKYSQGDGNFARVYGNFGVGAGVVTTDWVIGEYATT